MKRRHVWVATQGLVTVFLLVLLLRGLDLGALRQLFLRLPVSFYLASLLVVVAGQVAYAWRWRVLLVAAGVQAPFSLVVRQYFIGIFLNNFLPSTVGGDLAKVYLLGRAHGYGAVTASVLLDRMLGIGVLSACAAIILWTAPMPSSALDAARFTVTGIAATSFLVLVFMAVGSGGLPARVSALGPRAVAIAYRLQQLRVKMASALTSPVAIAQVIAVVVGYFLAVGAVYEIFITMQVGYAPSFATTLGVVMTTSVLSNIPISLNGLGLREQLHAVLLAPLGVPREVAVAISLLLFGQLLIVSIVGLIFWVQARALPSDPTAHLDL